MHRLFVAIRPPRPIREQLLASMGDVTGARWQTEDQLHITLRFIGEVDRHCANETATALGSIHHPRFDIALNGVGSFGRLQPKVLWAGVTPHEPLKALHKKIEQACVRAGLQPERRAYHPHITLARLKRDAGSIQSLLERSGGMQSKAFAVDSFALYESNLTPEGAVYTMAERYTLG